jgi:hypothetical protein
VQQCGEQITICKQGSCTLLVHFVGLAYQGKDIVFRFIIEYSSLKDFGSQVVGVFLYEEF